MSATSPQVDVLQLSAAGQIRRGAADRFDLAHLRTPVAVRVVAAGRNNVGAIVIAGATVGMRVLPAVGCFNAGGAPLVLQPGVDIEAVVSVIGQVQQLNVNDLTGNTYAFTLLPALRTATATSVSVEHAIKQLSAAGYIQLDATRLNEQDLDYSGLVTLVGTGVNVAGAVALVGAAVGQRVRRVRSITTATGAPAGPL